MSTTVMASTQRKHLNPLSPLKRKALGSIGNFNNLSNIVHSVPNTKDFTSLSKSTALASTKRKLVIYDENDENNSAATSIPCLTKRVKSTTSSSVSCSDSLAILPTQLLVVPSTKPVVQSFKPLAPSTKHKINAKPLQSLPKQQPSPTKGTKRPFSILQDSKIRKPSSPSSSSSIRRIDPPSHNNRALSTNSINSVLQSSSSHSSSSSVKRHILNPVPRTSSKLSQSCKPYPDSWFFDIHEDTAEENLTNLVHHHTGTLEISDDDEDEGSKSEIERRGKENIPPPPTVSEDTIAMPPPPTPFEAVRNAEVEVDVNAMDAERTRTPLGEISLKIVEENSKVEVKVVDAVKEIKRAGEMKEKSLPIIQVTEPEVVVVVEDDAKNIPLPTITEEEEAVLSSSSSW